MATVKWSAFTSGTTITGSDIAVGLQGGANVQWTMTQLKTWTSASPTLVTPTLGVATATSINKVALTAPATGATLTIADGKTLTASNSITLAGTDSTTMTFPSTSATIARTDAAQTFTGAQTFGSAIITGPAAATLQLGAADAASPVAQTLQFQSVSNGTSNVAGVDATFNLSVGTGTGAGGKLLIFGGVTGSSGPTPNSRVRNFEFIPATSVASGGAVLKVYREADAGATNTSFGYIESGVTANTLIIGSNKVGSPSAALTKLQINVDGTNKLDYNVAVASSWTFSGTVYGSSFQSTGNLQSSANVWLTTNGGVLFMGASNDVSARWEAAGILAVRGSTSTTAGALSLYTYGASPPAAPGASIARLYADTSGGKIRLMVIFPSGAAQQIAIEP